jgi:hypothetical protein
MRAVTAARQGGVGPAAAGGESGSRHHRAVGGGVTAPAMQRGRARSDERAADSLCRKGFEFSSIGEATLKGLDDPVTLYAVSEVER